MTFKITVHGFGGKPSGSSTRSTGEFLSRREAARLLGVSVRWLEADSTIPKINIARPGANRPTWRYSITALRESMAGRETASGRPR